MILMWRISFREIDANSIALLTGKSIVRRPESNTKTSLSIVISISIAEKVSCKYHCAFSPSNIPLDKPHILGYQVQDSSHTNERMKEWKDFRNSVTRAGFSIRWKNIQTKTEIEGWLGEIVSESVRRFAIYFVYLIHSEYEQRTRKEDEGIIV